MRNRFDRADRQSGEPINVPVEIPAQSLKPR
jgi:hypothetical protein